MTLTNSLNLIVDTLRKQGLFQDENTLIDESINYLFYQWLKDHQDKRCLLLKPNFKDNIDLAININLKDITDKEIYEFIYNDKYFSINKETIEDPQVQILRNLYTKYLDEYDVSTNKLDIAFKLLGLLMFVGKFKDVSKAIEERKEDIEKLLKNEKV